MIYPKLEKDRAPGEGGFTVCVLRRVEFYVKGKIVGGVFANKTIEGILSFRVHRT